ncbi:hypothetical protein Pcinc_013239 [Petrolisthes cinctipes]|uniref:Peptidase aspartic putative domain-containing protein n=1 Tax=Petrolisthes cinctipes TaxID=88211 RepID=A0AAE1FX87_PETCI|nr:hypothetical protein Pcinc_013239 [Petrolisthes cinctipes]
MEFTTIAQTRMPVESTVIALLVLDVSDTQKPCCIPEVDVRPTLNIDLSGLASKVEIQKWPHLQNLEIPQLEVDQVHLLIGQDCADLLLPMEIKKGRLGEPFAIRTSLGWAINGPIDPSKSAVRSSYFVHSISGLEKDPSKLWELEGINSESPGMSQNDVKILEAWDRSETLMKGHYTLGIPFKAERPCLPDNRTMAEKRLHMLRKRLDKVEDLKERYVGEIHKLVDKDYAEVVPNEDVNRADGKVWYFPHHPVHNPKKTDKTRVVFDCAAKFGGSSLNDHVCLGPDLANKLVGVLLRFREGAIAFPADIVTMYHQVKVTTDDRDVLRFLWLQDVGQLVTYRMTSHLFGGVWSPSCANYALHRVTKEFIEEFPEIVLNTILRNFYVDDCVKSTKTLDTALPLANQTMQLLARRGFHLTKFASNSPELLNSIPKEEWGKSFTTLDVRLDKLPRFVLKARKLFQHLCRLQKGWNESLPKDLEEQWGRWLSDLPAIREFSIPRCVIHHFCDASENGYGAVAYLRTRFDGEVQSCTSERCHHSTFRIRWKTSSSEIAKNATRRA